MASKLVNLLSRLTAAMRLGHPKSKYGQHGPCPLCNIIDEAESFLAETDVNAITSTELEKRLIAVFEHQTGQIDFSSGTWRITNYAYNSSFSGKTLLEAIEVGEAAIKATEERYAAAKKANT